MFLQEELLFGRRGLSSQAFRRVKAPERVPEGSGDVKIVPRLGPVAVEERVLFPFPQKGDADEEPIGGRGGIPPSRETEWASARDLILEKKSSKNPTLRFEGTAREISTHRRTAPMAAISLRLTASAFLPSWNGEIQESSK
jgi:hypothetical protein